MERVNLTDARTGRTITIPAAWLPGHKPETPAPKAETPKRKTKPKAKA